MKNVLRNLIFFTSGSLLCAGLVACGQQHGAVRESVRHVQNGANAFARANLHLLVGNESSDELVASTEALPPEGLPSGEPGLELPPQDEPLPPSSEEPLPDGGQENEAEQPAGDHTAGGGVISPEPTPELPPVPSDGGGPVAENPGSGTGGEPLPEEPQDESLALCQKHFVAKLAVVKVAGAHQSLALDKPAFVKVTGNQNQVAAVVPAGQTLSGMCLFLAGNQAQVKLSVRGSLDKLVVIARGNQANVELDVVRGAELKDFVVDLRGNKPKVLVTGEGEYSCPVAGKNAVSCK